MLASRRINARQEQGMHLKIRQLSGSSLQMIAQANDKLSLKKRQYKAALDMRYMKKAFKI
jgi:hypothetical protein